MVLDHSYPQVYPQIDLTDYIILHSRSGVKWRIVETGTFIRGALLMPKPQTSYPNTYTTYPNLCQTLYLICSIADYIPNISVCQLCFVPKPYDKFAKNLEKFVIIVIFFLKRYKKYPKQFRKDCLDNSVCYIGDLGIY